MKRCNVSISLLAGPTQREMWDHEDEQSFKAEGGIFCDNLFELVCRIIVAEYFIGFDSGPTHLAAQLGKPTVALFGPTGESVSIERPDMYYAEPQGPLVSVIRPNSEVNEQDKIRLRWIEPMDAVRRVREEIEKIQEERK